MSALRIALLGTPYVEHQGHHLAFSDRKALALLAFLATERGVHKRQKLARLLWPESDTAHGRTALRLALLHLRHTLEEDGPHAHLIVNYDALGLDMTSTIDLDLRPFEAAYDLAQNMPVPETMPEEARQAAIAHLQNAAALYRGDFLEEFTLRDAIDFDNWVGKQRQYWFNCLERIFDRLSQLQSAKGAFEHAIETVERWRLLDPLNEETYLRLMQLHLALGNRVTALKIYETCIDCLRTELHARPSPRLVALAERIRNVSLSSEQKSRVPEKQRGSSARPFLDIPFVGRSAELSRLMTLYERASSGQPQVVVIEGEAGIGKSRLAAAYLDWARIQGAGVLAGRAYKTHMRLSYQPLLDSLRTWVEREPDLHKLLSSTWLAELSRLLPELRERYPDLPPPTTDEAFAAARLLEALARLGRAGADQKPLLIFIDDIQWTDEATLDAFQYLFGHWAHHATAVLLLLIRRTETRSMEPQLADCLANLKSVAPLTRLELGPLSAQDLLQIIHSFSHEKREQAEHASLFVEPPSQLFSHKENALSPERLSDWLFAETGGQPFYTVAMLEALVEQGGLVPRSLQGKGWVFEAQASLLHPERLGNLLPANVREMIHSRLVRLSPAARELLAAGAVLDHDFSFEKLCQIAHLSLQDGLSALDEAMESLLLRESHQESVKRNEITYVFAHDKVREVVYLEAGEARRRIFHGRALETLEQVGASAAELAYHALASGAREAAFRWSVAAGDEAMKVFAIRDAIGHYEQANSLFIKHGATVSTKTAHLCTRLGQAYEHLNDFEAARTTYQTMLETARTLRDPYMECTALNRLAVLLSEDFSQVGQAMALLQEALGVAERHHDQEGLAETQWSLARVYYYVLNLDASLAHGKRAYTLACERGQQDLITKSLNILAYTTRALGQWEEAAATAEEARKRAVARGDRMIEADSLSRIADAHINCGRPHEAVVAARLAYAISLEIEHPWCQANSGYQLARGLVETGAYEEALTIALQSTEVARSLTFNVLLFVNLLALGLVYQALQLPAKALQIHLEGLEVSKTVPSQRYIGLSFTLLCVDSVLAGDWEAASAYAQQMLVTRDPQVVVCPEVPRWPEMEALLRADLGEQAAEALAVFEKRFGTNKRCHLSATRAQAVLAESQGRYECAQACLQEAIAVARALDLPGELWQAEAALSRLFLLRGEREKATQACTRARAILERLARDITNEELRSHFLASPRVQQILLSGEN